MKIKKIQVPGYLYHIKRSFEDSLKEFFGEFKIVKNNLNKYSDGFYLYTHYVEKDKNSPLNTKRSFIVNKGIVYEIPFESAKISFYTEFKILECRLNPLRDGHYNILRELLKFQKLSNSDSSKLINESFRRDSLKNTFEVKKRFLSFCKERGIKINSKRLHEGF